MLIPSIPNRCEDNCATFSMNDQLILSDGILWDVNSGREIHNFIHSREDLNGVFHPNGMEVITRKGVWDLRMFHLLKTVPSLDQMTIIFSPVNPIIYAFWRDRDLIKHTYYETSFKTLDAHDYSIIGKRLILAENVKITNPFKHT